MGQSSLSWGGKPGSGFEMGALHVQRIQNFEKNRLDCEIFGEAKNKSDRKLKGVTIELEFQDEEGKVVAKEDIALILKVVARRNARGEARPIKPEEYGNFVQLTRQCPALWLEGRFRYKIKNSEWE